MTMRALELTRGLITIVVEVMAALVEEFASELRALGVNPVRYGRTIQEVKVRRAQLEERLRRLPVISGIRIGVRERSSAGSAP
jgi:hypothetical protein